MNKVLTKFFFEEKFLNDSGWKMDAFDTKNQTVYMKHVHTNLVKLAIKAYAKEVIPKWIEHGTSCDPP